MADARRDRGGEQGLPGALPSDRRCGQCRPRPSQALPRCPIALQEQGGNAGDPSYAKLLDGLQVGGAGGGGSGVSVGGRSDGSIRRAALCTGHVALHAWHAAATCRACRSPITRVRPPRRPTLAPAGGGGAGGALPAGAAAGLAPGLGGRPGAAQGRGGAAPDGAPPPGLPRPLFVHACCRGGLQGCCCGWCCSRQHN